MHSKQTHHTTAKKGITGHSSDSEQVAAAERKAATEPWKAENAPNHPRKHGSLAVAEARKGFEIRWVREDSIDRRKMQGYQLANPKDYDLQADEKGMVRRNELVLMEIPTELYEERRANVNKQTDLQSQAAKKEFENESRKAGVSLREEDRDRDEE